MIAHLIPKRLLLSTLVAGVIGALALLTLSPAEAQGTASKTCTLTSTTNVYTCTFTITPAASIGPGPWLVQMATPGPGSFISPAVVSSSTTGCSSLPTVTAGSYISPQFGTADYDVTIGSGGCIASASVVITETVAVTASGQVCQNVWITAMSPFVSSCASVVFTEPAPTPSAMKTCTVTPTPNVYTCSFTVTPAFPATGNDFIHVNEAPGPPMTGPGTITSTPTVGSYSGCAEAPAPVVLSSSTSYLAQIGPSGCPGTTWSVEFIETITVTASGQICQSFYMVAAVPPATSCATVVFVPQTAGPSVVKTCTLTSTPNVYTCDLTITPAAATPAGVSWLVQMVSPGPGTFTSPSPTISTSTTGCGTGAALPSVTVGTLISTPFGSADYDVTIGSAGCSTAAVVVITETVAVTASGELCQTVWITAGNPGVTACATVQLAKSLGFSGGTIAMSGISIVAFTGTMAELDAAGAANTPKIVSATASTGGKLFTYVVGAPMFVNAAFNTAFPGGLDSTLIIVKTRG